MARNTIVTSLVMGVGALIAASPVDVFPRQEAIATQTATPLQKSDINDVTNVTYERATAFVGSDRNEDARIADDGIAVL